MATGPDPGPHPGERPGSALDATSHPAPRPSDRQRGLAPFDRARRLALRRAHHGRSRPTTPRCRREAGAHLHQTRPGDLLGRGDLPRGSRRRVSQVSGPGATRTVLGDPEGRDRRSRRRSRGDLLVVRDRADRRGIDCPGPRGDPGHRRGRGRQGPATPGGRTRPPGPAGHGLGRAAARGSDPGGGAGEPACAGRAVRRDDRRGARFPARGREHARHRPCAGRARRARLGDPTTPSRTGHPPGSGDGTDRRLSLRRRDRDHRRRDRHGEHHPHRHDQLPGRMHAQGHLPRGPAFGESAGHGRRPDRVVGLRHHRSPGHPATPGVSAARDERDRQQPPGTDRARWSRSAPSRRTATSTRSSRSWAWTIPQWT